MQLWLPPVPNAIVEPLALRASLCVLSCLGNDKSDSSSFLPAAMVAAEYKTNHYIILYAVARSPEVKIS